MMDFVKNLFSRASAQNGAGKASEAANDVRVAVCALCIEMARIDSFFSPDELDHVIQVLKDKYQLPPESVSALMESAEQELAESVDLWQFARLINETYSTDEKIQLIEILWQIVYVDGKMDEHEHYLMNKLSNLLRLTHSQLIEAKLKVLKANRA